MKDASNIFYCCRKSVYDNKGQKTVKFLTYVGPHPLMDTGTRDMALKTGDFVEDFTYDKWQQMIEQGTLQPVKVVVADEIKEEKESQED